MRSYSLARLARHAMVGLIAVSTLTMSVHAQGRGGGGGGGPGGGGFGRMMGGDMMGAPISTRDLDAFSKTLNLTSDQMETAKALVEGVATQYQPIAKAMRDKRTQVQKEVEETGDPTAWQSLTGQFAELRQARAKIESSFMNDFKAILTPEQTQLWPAAERAYRRGKSVGRGMMSGERVDLFRLVERLKLTPEQEAPLKEALDQYSIDLDRELTKRNEVQEKMMDEGNTLFAAFMGGGDAEKAQQMIEKGREAASRVRDVNRRYERQIEPLLPEDKRAEFAQEFKRESFPMVYRPTYSARVLDAAEKFDDLDANQKAAIAAARESFTRELNAISTRGEAAWEDMEKNFSVQGMRGGAGGGGPGGMFNNPKIQEFRDARDALDTQTVEKVNSILTEAQRAKLPERDNGRDGGGFRPRQNGGGTGNTNGDTPRQPRRQRGGGQQTRDPRGDA